MTCDLGGMQFNLDKFICVMNSINNPGLGIGQDLTRNYAGIVSQFMIIRFSKVTGFKDAVAVSFSRKMRENHFG